MPLSPLSLNLLPVTHWHAAQIQLPFPVTTADYTQPCLQALHLPIEILLVFKEMTIPPPDVIFLSSELLSLLLE